MKIETLALLAVFGLVSYRLLLWLMEAKRTPDPWGAEVEKELERPEAMALCHRCLAPQEHHGWFCLHCGATVGSYSNYLPSVYPFSIGEALRAGVTERIRLHPLIVAGYVLISLACLSIFGLIYSVLLIRNLARNTGARHEPT